MSTSPRNKLISLCIDALEKKNLENKTYKERLKLEIQELDAQDDHEYFLEIYSKGIKYPYNQNNLLIPFLLDIVKDFDINREPSYTEGEYPDIDTDLIGPVRDHIKNEWAPTKFGKDCVCNIGSYNTYGMRSSLVDMGKVHGKDRDEMLLISKTLDAKDDEGDAMTWEKALEINAALAEFCEKSPDIFDAAQRIHNRNRSMGKHAGGLIISSKPLANLVPLVLDKDGMVTSAWTEGLHSQDLGPVGLIKYDFLTLSNLMQIARIVKLVKRRHKIDKICALPGQKDWSDTSYLNDPKALEMANKGDLKCIFQFDSWGIRRLAKDGGVGQFDDLAAYAALYRPGPLGMGMHDRYVARKHGREKYTIPECLKPYLSNTYGVMVFQEQVMFVLNIIGNIPKSLGIGVIKAISKKKLDKFLKYKERFIQNGPEKLYEYVEPEQVKDIKDIIKACETPEEAANYAFYQGMENPYRKAVYILAAFYKIKRSDEFPDINRERLCREVAQAYARYFWDQIEAFAGYGFNAAHTVSYTYISCRLLYLKAHFPLEFFAGILSCEKDENKIRDYKTEALIHNVKLNPVNINKSDVYFSIYEKGEPSVKDEIYFGLSNVKGIGEGAAEKIVEHQPYSSFEDFLNRFGTNSNTVKPLMALRVFEGDPEKMYKFYEEFKSIQKNRKDRKKRNQNKLAEYDERLKEIVDDPELITWDEGYEIWKPLDKDEIVREKVTNPKDPNYGRYQDKVVNKYKQLKAMYKRRLRVINDFAEKERIAKENPFTMSKFNANDSKAKVPDEFKKYWQFPDSAEEKYLGFRWEHPLEKCPDFQGCTFADHRTSDDTGPVEVVVEDIKKREWKNKKGFSWKLFCEDANGENQAVTIWDDDYQIFQDSFATGKLLRLQLKPFDVYGISLYSPPRNKRKALPPKELDFRVLELAQPEINRSNYE